MTPTHPHAGFSLIEVMVAILILGIALAGLTTALQVVEVPASMQ
jgi:prepilin-type N-terminal cleavage/methylation domain-containing protein